MDIEEIRKRRAAIDGAPWKYASVPDQRVYGTSPGGCDLQVSDYPVCQVRGWGHLQYRGGPEAQALQDANGMFIAHAPDDIDFLLAVIAHMEAHLAAPCPSCPTV